MLCLTTIKKKKQMIVMTKMMTAIMAVIMKMETSFRGIARRNNGSRAMVMPQPLAFSADLNFSVQEPDITMEVLSHRF